jgi:hypothetical protein
MQVGNLVELSATAKKLICMKSLKDSVGLVERVAGQIYYIRWIGKLKNSKNLPIHRKNLKVAK